ncbi:MAG: hypothetical protein AAFZ65_17625 [Planctomycetota bacterium]
MRLTIPSLAPLLLAAAVTSGCAFHSTATQWHGRVGINGRPVLYASTTKVGTNVLIAVPFLGHLSIDGQIDTLTRTLLERGGDHIRIVQGETENYWYGFPPFTWFITPVVTTISAEFEPSESLLREVLRERIVEAHEDDNLSADEIEVLVDAELERFARGPRDSK